MSKSGKPSKPLAIMAKWVVIKIIQYAKWSIERISALVEKINEKKDQNALDLHNFGWSLGKNSGRLGALNCLSGLKVSKKKCTAHLPLVTPSSTDSLIYIGLSVVVLWFFQIKSSSCHFCYFVWSWELSVSSVWKNLKIIKLWKVSSDFSGDIQKLCEVCSRSYIQSKNSIVWERLIY